MIRLLLIKVAVLISIFSSVSIIENKQYKKPLLLAIAAVESNYNTKAVSKKGAIGLMQIRYSVWGKELKKEGIIRNKNDLFNPKLNVKAANYILVKYGLHSDHLENVLYKYSGKSKSYSKKVIKEME